MSNVLLSMNVALSCMRILGEQLTHVERQNKLHVHQLTHVYDMDVAPMRADGFKSVGTDTLSGKLGNVMSRVANVFGNKQPHDSTAMSSGANVYLEAPSF